MATRAQQFEALAVGVIKDGALITTPYAKFLAAGTSSTKDAYADKDKAVSFTKLALDSDGRGVAYGDGVYTVEIYSGDPDSGGTKQFEIANIKVVAVLGNTRSVTAAAVTGSVDDFLVKCDTTSNNITYTLPDATLMESRSLALKKTVAANTVTVDTTGSQTVDGGTSVSFNGLNAAIEFVSDGANWFGKQVTGDASTLDGVASSGYVKTDGSNEITGNQTISGNLTTTGAVSASGNVTVTGVAIIDNSDGGLRIKGYDGSNDAYIHGLDGSGDDVLKITRNGTSDYDLYDGSGNLFWTAGNDGTGSGLDADTLDGVEADAFVKLSGGGGLNAKVVNIGDWNMTTAASVDVTHGVTYSKIVSVTVLVRDDADNNKYTEGSSSSANSNDMWVEEVTSTVVTLRRETSGFFDSINFDSTSYNRGWVTIWYTD